MPITAVIKNFTARVVGAEEARQLGMAYRVTSEDVLADALAFAERFASAPTEAIGYTKRVMNHALKASAPRCSQQEALAQTLRKPLSPGSDPALCQQTAAAVPVAGLKRRRRTLKTGAAGADPASVSNSFTIETQAERARRHRMLGLWRLAFGGNARSMPMHSVFDVHDRCLHQRHHFGRRINICGIGQHSASAHGQQFAGILHLAHGHKALANGRAQQVDLEFGGHHFITCRRFGQRGIEVLQWC